MDNKADGATNKEAIRVAGEASRAVKAAGVDKEAGEVNREVAKAGGEVSKAKTKEDGTAKEVSKEIRAKLVNREDGEASKVETSNKAAGVDSKVVGEDKVKIKVDSKVVASNKVVKEAQAANKAAGEGKISNKAGVTNKEVGEDSKVETSNKAAGVDSKAVGEDKVKIKVDSKVETSNKAVGVVNKETKARIKVVKEVGADSRVETSNKAVGAVNKVVGEDKAKTKADRVGEVKIREDGEDKVMPRVLPKTKSQRIISLRMVRSDLAKKISLAALLVGIHLPGLTSNNLIKDGLDRVNILNKNTFCSFLE